MKELFSDILDMTEKYGWGLYLNTDNNGNSWIVGQAFLDNSQILKLKQISKEACTAGAIELRNRYRNDKLPVNGWAVDLRNGSDIEYYEDEKGNIIKDPLALFEHLQVGDLLIYSNPKNPEGKKGKDENGNNYGFTGHTASIISKTKNYVITLEFHENGKDPTINLIYKNTLLWFNDTDLYGGASWK